MGNAENIQNLLTKSPTIEFQINELLDILMKKRIFSFIVLLKRL